MEEIQSKYYVDEALGYDEVERCGSLGCNAMRLSVPAYLLFAGLACIAFYACPRLVTRLVTISNV